MSNKHVVTFLSRMSDVTVGKCCLLAGVQDHPKLGNCGWVRTSTVVHVRNKGNTIETLNTIYTQRKL